VKKDELTSFDGKEGKKSYVSYQGKIYDVTDSRLWKNGKHVNKHHAGMDLSEAMESAPHGADVLERFQMVGEIDGFKPKKREKNFKETVRKLYKIFHPHPMLIHFPMGLIKFTIIMQILFFMTGNRSFEVAGFYSIVVSTLFIIPTVLSGMVSWWVNYDLTINKLFMVKLILSIVLFFMGVLEIWIRLDFPDVAVNGGGLGMFYNLLLFANVPVLGIIGFNGGKLSWG